MKTQKKTGKVKMSPYQNTNLVENTGLGLKFVATRREYDAEPAEAIPNSFIGHFERRVVGSDINFVR